MLVNLVSQLLILRGEVLDSIKPSIMAVTLQPLNLPGKDLQLVAEKGHG